MELSKRLAAVAGMVTNGNAVCDVGCDHGYVSIYLVKQGISPRAIAMDVRKGPLSQAEQNIRMYGLSDYIETRLSDGVDALENGEADTLILAGMGGKLMESILTRGWDKVICMRELILQPQSEIPLFRKFLRDSGFGIVTENMVYEDEKFYPMMRVIPLMQGVAEDTPQEDNVLTDLYGGLLLKQRHPVLKQYLDFQNEKLTRLLKELTITGRVSEKSRNRVEEVKKELFFNELAKKQYDI